MSGYASALAAQQLGAQPGAIVEFTTIDGRGVVDRSALVQVLGVAMSLAPTACSWTSCPALRRSRSARRSWRGCWWPADGQLSWVGSVLASSLEKGGTSFGENAKELRGEDRPSTQSKGRQRDLMPLPLCGVSDEDLVKIARRHPIPRTIPIAACRDWVAVVVAALNYRSGDREAGARTFGPPTTPQLKSLVFTSRAVHRFLQASPENTREVDCGADLRDTKLAYEGEEVAKAEHLTWEQAVPCLPLVGVVGQRVAADIAMGYVRKALLYPRKVLPAGELQSTPRRSNIWADRKVWEELASELFKRELVMGVQPEEVHVLSCRRVLNGAFGVHRGEDPPSIGRGGVSFLGDHEFRADQRVAGPHPRGHA